METSVRGIIKIRTLQSPTTSRIIHIYIYWPKRRIACRLESENAERRLIVSHRILYNADARASIFPAAV
jgi:hypothetical protein